MDPKVYDYLYSLNRLGSKPGLERIQKVLNLLGNPEKKFKSIHFTGTNGKGSTIAFTYFALKENNYNVGIFTSPHLENARERIQINEEKISEKDFERLIKKIHKLNEEEKIGLTFFEFMTALAFEYFEEKKPDIALIEVGMGGMLDSTNTIVSEASVITKIEYDHMDFLGENLANIAAEKAGIIKQGKPAIIGVEQKNLIQLIEKKCIEKKSSLINAFEKFEYTRTESAPDFEKFTAEDISSDKKYDIVIGLGGEHQIKNSLVALALLQKLKEQGWNLEFKKIIKGFEKTKWAARSEVIQKNPLVLVDAAHNPDGINALKKSLKEWYHGKKIIFVFGASKNRKYTEMVELLTPIAKRFYFGKNSRKGIDTKELEVVAGKNSIDSQEFEVPADAFNAALSEAEKDDVIVVTGSIYFIGDIYLSIKKII